MTHFRDFSSSNETTPQARDIGSDAPAGLRHELIDLVFHLAEHNSPPLSEERMHRIICQSIGVSASGQPYSGFRYAAARDLGKARWERVYDVISRLWPEFQNAGLADQYFEGVNRILSGYGVVWEFSETGRLQRHLPVPAYALVNAAIEELRDPRYAAALTLFSSAMDAFDDRPRRDRDACANIFDSMESVAKEVSSMPSATFGAVLGHIRQTNRLTAEIISVLEAINTLRNRKFGHGMTNLFDLSAGEVDFTYLSCIGGMLILVKI
ncbi:MAG TPA: hypothetical protein DCZ69_16125 [Syntrophobacteraceae bacterium]|nr:hypothetical protein [Syntrophobacteraceae bacterium]HBZ57159.1 hypothetical protein [Syntrophobacteraceae bacterium]